MNLEGVGVVIPAYNAEKTIGRLIGELLEYGVDKKNIIVVDDGSKDYTSRVVTGFGLSLVCHEKNKGKGAALMTGFDVARTKKLNHVLTMDADGQHCVAEIKEFLKLKGTYDLIIGSRRYPSMPFLRRMTNRTTSLVISLLCKKHICDTQSGFRCINPEIFDKVKLRTRNFQTEAELVVRAVRNRYRVGFVPITTIYNRGHSYINPLFDTMRFVNMALRFLWH